MSDDAKVNMVLCLGLSPTEQENLEAIEGDVVRLVLKELGRTERLIWTAGTDDGERFIRLRLADSKSTVLMEICASDLAGTSPEALLARLQRCCEEQSQPER
jgi:hypothetical protein